MPITKSIVGLMNGNIEVISEKGKGTTFTIRIPMRQEKNKQRNSDSSEKKNGKSNSRNSKKKNSKKNK